MESGLALQKAGTSLPLSPALRAQALSPPQTSGGTPTSSQAVGVQPSELSPGRGPGGRVAWMRSPWPAPPRAAGPLTLLLHHGEAPLAQMTVAPSLTLGALQSLGLPYFPCPGGGAQWKPSPGMEFVKVPSDTASCLPSLPSAPAISSWADHVGAHCPQGVATCPLCAEGSHPLGVMSTSLAAN